MPRCELRFLRRMVTMMLAGFGSMLLGIFLKPSPDTKE